MVEFLLLLHLGTTPPTPDPNAVLSALEQESPPAAGLRLPLPRIATVVALLELHPARPPRVTVASTAYGRSAARTIRARLLRLATRLPRVREARTLSREFVLGGPAPIPIQEWVEATRSGRRPDLRDWPDLIPGPGPCLRAPGTRAFGDALALGLQPFGDPADPGARVLVPEHYGTPGAEVFFLGHTHLLLVRSFGNTPAQELGRWSGHSGFEICLKPTTLQERR